MRLGGSDVALDPAPGDEESVTPIAYLTDAEDEPVQILERAETARNRSVGLQRAMAKLDDRSRRIIEARWLKEEDPATLQELADEYGVSAERIRQIESKAIKTMRGQMAAAYRPSRPNQRRVRYDFVGAQCRRGLRRNVVSGPPLVLPVRPAPPA